MEERSGNMLVKNMKQEILDDVQRLGFVYPTKRVLRQSRDATKFLDMISKAPYTKCRTVSDLKKKISVERNKLKDEMVSLDRFMPGHQFTLFEDTECISEEEKREVALKITSLKDEIHWLHKCLGMCSSRTYFK